MAVDFNHTILSARDSKASANFLAEMLGLPAPRRWGPFHMVRTDNDAENAPMLHINEALGYVRRPGWVEHHKRVKPTGA